MLVKGKYIHDKCPLMASQVYQHIFLQRQNAQVKLKERISWMSSYINTN